MFCITKTFSFIVATMILPVGFATLCNIDNCDNLTNEDLEDRSFYFDPTSDLTQTFTRIVSFSALTSNCSITFAAEAANGATYLEINWLISQTSIEVINRLTGIVNGFNFQMDITDHFRIDTEFSETIEFHTQLIPKENETFLRILIQEKDNERIIRDEYLNYAERFDTANRQHVQRMVRGLPVNNNAIKRSLKTEHCSGHFTIRLCPCVEPDVSLERKKTDISCRGGSIDEIAELLWFKNDEVLSQSDTGEKDVEGRQKIGLFKSSTLTNITQTRQTVTYACQVKTRRNKTRKRSITIPALYPKAGNSAGGGNGTGDNSEGTQKHIVYIISSVVCALVVTLVISAGLIVYLTKEKKKRGDIVRATNPAVTMQTQVPTPTVKQDLLLYQSLDDLLQLLDSVAYDRPYNTAPGAASENTYDKLDPRLMTVNGGGRIESTYRLSSI